MMWVCQNGFDYVIQKQEKQRICFGSGCARDTSRRGMTPFMKHYTLDDYPNVAPTTYNALQSFKAVNTKPCLHSISRKGYSGLARFAKKIHRREDYPSPSDYDTCQFPEKVRESKYPFASTSKRKTFIHDKNPGPGMYVSSGKRAMRFEHSFGGTMKMQLGVDLKCCSKNVDICNVCEGRPAGDYWHLNNDIFLCRPCMDKEMVNQSKYNKSELKLFRKIRDCSSIHQHEGTNAKLWLMHPSNIGRWVRREAYLSAYLTG